MVVLRYSPGFYPFSDPSPSTHPGPSLVLAQISIFSDTRSDPTSPGTRPDLSRVLARIPPFSGTRPYFHLSGTQSGPFSVLTRMLPSRYSPRFPIFSTRPDFYLPGTCPDPTFSDTHPDSPFSVLARIFTYPVLARILTFPVFTRIPHFWYLSGFLPSQYSPGSHLSGTRSDSTFFGTCPDITISRYLPRSHLSGTHPDFTFPVLTRILPFLVLAWISIFRNLLGFPFFGPGRDSTFLTHRDSTFSDTHPDPIFSDTCPYPSPELARIS